MTPVAVLKQPEVVLARVSYPVAVLQNPVVLL
jgi:hypothetical protein